MPGEVTAVRWFRHRKNRAETARSAEDVAVAREALRELEQSLQEAHGRTSEISAIARTLRRRGDQNHFAPLVRDALGGRFG